MMKQKRKVLVIADLEAKLEKYGRRMQKISEEAYNTRQLLEYLQAQEKENALHHGTSEEGTSVDATDQNTRESDVPNSTTSSEVLDQQPPELPSNI